MNTQPTLDETSTASQDARRKWLAVLARAPLDMLEAAFKFIQVPGYGWLRRPETGIYMVRARIGGSGNRFNMGEVTVTRCVVRITEGPTGLGYVLGRSHRHAELCALADAMLHVGVHSKAVQRSVIAPIERYLNDQRAQMARKAQSTRVDFLTMAREGSTELASPPGSSNESRATTSLSEDAA